MGASGGKVDQKESFDQALIREVYEETQLKIALDHVVGVSEQNLHLIRAVHIIMAGKILEGKLNLSNEHEGYAWVFFENLPEYELADWLQDFLMGQTRTADNRQLNDNNKKEPQNSIKPWITTLQTSMDKILKR